MGLVLAYTRHGNRAEAVSKASGDEGLAVPMAEKKQTQASL